MKWRKTWILGGLLATLLVAGGSILRYERVLAQGTPVLLALAPVDPRSIMQGDYMVLRYAVDDERRRSQVQAAPEVSTRPGVRSRPRVAVLRLTADGEGVFQRAQAELLPLEPEEIAIRLRVGPGGGSVAPTAFFFEEGRAAHFEAARYAEVRVAANGTTLLVGLRDEAYAPL